MHQFSQRLIRTDILLVIVGVTLALLFGLSIGLMWWHSVAGVLDSTAFVTYIGSLATIIGGIVTGLTGLAIKAIAWGLRRYRL